MRPSTRETRMALFRISNAVCLMGIASVSIGCSGEKGASSSSANNSSTPAGAQIVTVTSALTAGARIWLTGSVLARLQQRAAANDPAWTALASRCDADATGTIETPAGDAYPDPPGIGQGYEGDAYIPEIMALGLCYQTASGVDDTSATRWAQAGARLLSAMAIPASSGGEDPSTDSGYGIRNFGVGMAVGYDWLRPALDATTKTSVQTALEAWIAWYDASGFVNNEPVANYFAGYLFAKGAAAIALEGDDANATTWWADVSTRLWTQLAQPTYGACLAGGGWPEGWQYGPLSVQNIVGLLWAANTGKGMSWWTSGSLARTEAAYVGQFAWPSRKHMDDRGTIHAQTALTPSSSTVAMMATVLGQQGDAFASSARGIANDLQAATGESIVPWQEFLFWDKDAASTPPSSLPMSYWAEGPAHVAMRSSWTTDATWASFASGPYIDAQDSGEQYFDEGSLAVATGDQPVLVNATGWLPQAAGDDGESYVYDDTWGNSTRLLNNTFYVTGAKQDSIGPDQSKTHVERYEDGGGFVRSRGAAIDQMYTPSGVVSQFIRDVAYVRPSAFVIYDRTTATSGADQWLAWHVPGTPTQSTASDGSVRFDVPTGGTIRSLLPSGATVATTNVLSVVTRIELHASAAAQDWLTVVTTGGSPDVQRLSAADGTVTSGAVVGAHIVGSPRESVVLFPSDHAGTGNTMGADYVVTQAADADHVLFDMAPGGYTVTATPGGSGTLAVHVGQGGSLQPTASGTLAFAVTAAGAVSAQTAAAVPTTPAATAAETATPAPASTTPPAPSATTPPASSPAGDASGSGDSTGSANPSPASPGSLQWLTWFQSWWTQVFVSN